MKFALLATQESKPGTDANGSHAPLTRPFTQLLAVIFPIETCQAAFPSVRFLPCGDEPKVERLLDFPPPRPILTACAFPSKTLLPGIFA